MEIKGGITPRISPFVDIKDAGNLLIRTGFSLPVAEKDLYDMAKSFASSVGKGEIEAKHGTEESNNTPY